MKRHPTGFRRALVGVAVGLPVAFIAAAALAAVLLSGCTKPLPPAPPGPPDAADAAPAPALIRSCDAACKAACVKAAAHAETVVAGSGAPSESACVRIADPKFTACVTAATDRDALNRCDRAK